MSTEIVRGPTTDMDHAEPSERREEASTLQAILRAAKDPTTNIATVKELMAMHREMVADAAAKSFKGAMARLQAALPQIAKSGVILDKSGNTRNKFAKLEDIDVVVRPMLAEEGFSFSYDTKPMPGGSTEYVLTISHRDGHAETKSLPLPVDSGPPGRSKVQDAGSSLSYARRYLLIMALNLVTRDEDDDGTAAGAKPISTAQAEQLHGKLTELQANDTSVARFLNYMAAPSVDEIASANFARAINFLDEKIRMKGAK